MADDKIIATAPEQKEQKKAFSNSDKIAYDWDFITYLENKFEKRIDKKMRESRAEKQRLEDLLETQKSENVSHETKSDNEFSITPFILLILGGALLYFGIKNGKTQN